MKVKVNDKVIFELAEWEKNVLKHEIPTEIFDADMERRLEWVLKHLVEQCYNRFEKEWIEKLRAKGVASIPTDKASFVALVLSQPDYKNRSQSDSET